MRVKLACTGTGSDTNPDSGASVLESVSSVSISTEAADLVASAADDDEDEIEGGSSGGGGPVGLKELSGWSEDISIEI